MSNATRGVLAEFIVASAIGLAHGARTEWDAYDLQTPAGIKVEVKSAAYLQSWRQRDLSRICFSVRRTMGWDASTGEMATATRRQANVYVFCLLAHKDKATVDPLNLDQWEFYVLPTRVLDERLPQQKTLGLAGLLQLRPVVATYSTLAAGIQAAADLLCQD